MTPISYHIVGMLPVKLVRSPSGRLGVYKMSWKTGVFELGMQFYYRTHSSDGDVDEVSEDEFIQHVESLRAQRLNPEGTLGALYPLIKAMEEKGKSTLTPEERTWLAETKRQTHALFQAEHPDPEYP